MRWLRHRRYAYTGHVRGFREVRRAGTATAWPVAERIQRPHPPREPGSWPPGNRRLEIEECVTPFPALADRHVRPPSSWPLPFVMSGLDPAITISATKTAMNLPH